MNGETFDELVQWQRAKVRRTVTVFIESKGIQAWVYDYDLVMGQFVTAVSEIDLEQEKEDQLNKMIAELKKSRSVVDQPL